MSQLAQPLARLLDDDGDGLHALGDWRPLIDAWRHSVAGRLLIDAVDARVASGAVVHPAEVFRALTLTPLAKTRVLILGQDPYHGLDQAEGLAFSVAPGQKIPPSLRNIQRELLRDLGLPPPTSGSLIPWARQGVLLLNTALTVEAGSPASHARLGWSALTDSICAALAQDPKPKVFMLWGAHAQQRRTLLRRQEVSGVECHLMLQCNHPSPLSAMRPPAPFIDCGHFGAANRFLRAAGAAPVDWRLP